MDIVKKSREIKSKKESSRDIVYTNISLARKLISLVPLKKGDIVLDPCAGKFSFFNSFPTYVDKKWCEVVLGVDFFDYEYGVDWLISNPPYSILNDWLEKTCRISQKGFAYLLGTYSITPKRLELIEAAGFYLTDIHYFKVSQWFGISCFVIFKKLKSKPKVNFTYERKVYQSIHKHQTVIKGGLIR